jgi:hypothetical protein
MRDGMRRVAGVVGAAASLASVGICVVGVGAAAASSTASMKSKLVTLSEMPAGWVAVPESGKRNADNCLNVLIFSTPFVHASFGVSGGGEEFAESLTAYSSSSKARAAYAAKVASVSRCNNATLQAGGQTGRIRVASLKLPTIGAESSAHAMTIRVGQMSDSLNFLYFEQGRYIGVLVQTDTLGGTPDVTTETRLDRVALNQLEGVKGSAPAS